MKKAFCFLLAMLIHIKTVYANTEKLILRVNSQDAMPCDPQFEALNNAQAATSLKPPFSQVQSSLIPQNDFQWYNLDELKDSASYEIRISYPAITPADFRLNIINSCKRADGSLSYTLQVSAKYTGVSQIKEMANQPVIYDLVLENLYLGFLFYQVYKIAIAIIVVLLIGYLLWMPYIRHLITEKPKIE